MWEGSENEVIPTIETTGEIDEYVDFESGLNINIDNDSDVENYGDILFQRLKYLVAIQKQKFEEEKIEIDEKKIERYHEISEILKKGAFNQEEQAPKKGFLSRLISRKEAPIQSKKSLLNEYEELLNYIEDISNRQVENAKKEKERICKIYGACQLLLEAFDMYIENGFNMRNYYNSAEPEKLCDRKANLEALYERIIFLQNIQETLQVTMTVIEKEQEVKKRAVNKLKNKRDKLVMTRFTLTLETYSVNFGEEIEIIRTLEESADAILMDYIYTVGKNCQETVELSNSSMLGSKVIQALETTMAQTELLTENNPLGIGQSDIGVDFSLSDAEVPSGWVKKKK